MFDRTKSASGDAAQSGPAGADAEPGARVGLKGMNYEEGQAALEPEANVAKRVELALETLTSLADKVRFEDAFTARDQKSLERVLKVLVKADLARRDEADKDIIREDLYLLSKLFRAAGREKQKKGAEVVDALISQILSKIGG